MNGEAVAPLLNGIALATVLVALVGVRAAAAREPVAARLQTVYRLVAALLIFRLAAAWVGDGALPRVAGAATLLVAAWLPLAALKLVEELTRRHAPRLIKLAALVGAIAFSALAVTLGLLWPSGALIALAAFQAAALATMIALLWRERATLAGSERRTADTLLLALALTIPLALTDFRALFPNLVLRGGPFAVLAMVLATSRLASGDGAPRRLLADLALCLGGGGLISAALAFLQRGTDDSWIPLAGCGFAVTALALLIERFGRARAQAETLVEALARAPDGGVDEVIAAHPLLAEGRVLDAAALADYPPSAIAALALHRVIGEALDDPDADAAARDLLDATAATHLVRLSHEPPRFLAVSAGALAGPAIAHELAVAAMLVERRG